MQYQVKQQLGQSAEKQLKEFGELQDAKKFVEEKLSSDVMYKTNLNAVYRIYRFDEEMVEEWTQAKWQKKIADTQSGGGSPSSGAQSQSGFSPTPLSTSPRPPGTPPSSFGRPTDEEEK